MTDSKEKNRENYGTSLYAKAWKRLVRNKPAIIGIGLILGAVTLAILGYLVTPDSTPFANEQILQIGTKPPGFAINMLKVRKNKEVEKVGFFNKMINGREDRFSYIPLNSFQFVEDEMIIKEYTGGGFDNDVVKKVPDIVFAKSISKPEIHLDGDKLTFFDLNNNEVVASLAELQQIIKDKHIVRKRYILGTDKFGRDVLSRMIIGVRISLAVGFIAVIISLFIGITLGGIAGYFRGAVDDVIMYVINVIWSIPTLLLVFAITLALGKGFWQIFVAVGLSMWVEVARVVRGQVLSIREIEFVEATRALGYGSTRIIFLHILPNVLGPVMVIAAANFAAAILIEAGLSFLGIGVQPPTPSWGWMMKEYYGHIISGDPFLAIIPGLAIMIMVLAFNLLGNGLRDALDVKGRV
ncbi:MAG: ABC transporter permease [Bacteroidetes bacterium]|nr:ABC transporter permease [Bacteroidota bacterium]